MQKGWLALSNITSTEQYTGANLHSKSISVITCFCFQGETRESVNVREIAINASNWFICLTAITEQEYLLWLFMQSVYYLTYHSSSSPCWWCITWSRPGNCCSFHCFPSWQSRRRYLLPAKASRSYSCLVRYPHFHDFHAMWVLTGGRSADGLVPVAQDNVALFVWS